MAPTFRPSGSFRSWKRKSQGCSNQTLVENGAVLAFSCGDVLHEVAAAAESNLKRPSLRNFQTFRIANTAWTVLLGFASQFLSYTRAVHVSHDSLERRETNSEHSQPFTKTIPSLWLLLSSRFLNETCSSNCLSPRNCRACLGRCPTQRGVALVLCFFGSPAPALAYRKRIVALPLPALPVFANWQLVLPPF